MKRAAASIATTWPSFEPVITRYLAAKAFASWAAYQQDDGTAAVVRGVETARAPCYRSRLLASALRHYQASV